MTIISRDDEEAEEYYRELTSLFPKEFALAIADTFSPLGKSRGLWCNKAWEELFGYSREEICLIDPRELFVNLTDRDKWLELLLDQGFVENFKAPLKTKQGDTFIGYGNGILQLYRNATYLIANVSRSLEESHAFNHRRKSRFIEQN
ncbi:MAG: PAS domain-containing protein [Candidatus Thorarchaeota archaeon]